MATPRRRRPVRPRVRVRGRLPTDREDGRETPDPEKTKTSGESRETDCETREHAARERPDAGSPGVRRVRRLRRRPTGARVQVDSRVVCGVWRAPRVRASHVAARTYRTCSL